MLAGAPLGDPADASPRLREALRSADVVAAEDTRRLRRLAADLDVTVPGRIVRHDDATEEAGTPGLVDQLLAGRTVLLVTDGGMPSVSDPGYRLVSAAVAAGVPVTAVPGPSAVTTALALSGLPSDRFCFEGFLPRRPGERRRALDGAAGRAAHGGAVRGPAPAGRDAGRRRRDPRPGPAGGGLPGDDQDLRGGPPGHAGRAGGLGRGRGARARSRWWSAGRRGGRPRPTRPRWPRRWPRREQAGTDRKAAIAEVAQEAGLPKRVVYAAVVAAR